MIRVILDQLPDNLSDEINIAIVSQNHVLVDGIYKPALYFDNQNLALAESLGGNILITREP